jgi:hypothetical protein
MLRLAFPASPAALALGLGLSFGCGGPPANGPQRPLPSYTGHSVELFDDAIEAKALGLDLEASQNPRMDSRLRERAEVGDAVLRVRVSTVSAKEEDAGSRYLLGFETLEKLGGFFPPGPQFTLVVDRKGSSLGIVKSFGARLVGKSFVAFVRLFVRADGDTELHFHLAPDSKDELAAVHDATVGAAAQKRD